jgi:hypothetical protein
MYIDRCLIVSAGNPHGTVDATGQEEVGKHLEGGEGRTEHSVS